MIGSVMMNFMNEVRVIVLRMICLLIVMGLLVV